MANYPKRGEIYLVNFDPAIGSEVKKTRPAVILQNNNDNEFSPITIVGALTSQAGTKIYPTEVFVVTGEGGLSLDSIVQLNQIRMIDKQRLRNRLGSLNLETMRKVDRALKISLDIDGVVG